MLVVSCRCIAGDPGEAFGLEMRQDGWTSEDHSLIQLREWLKRASWPGVIHVGHRVLVRGTGDEGIKVLVILADRQPRRLFAVTVEW